jgi:hypothetical protein
MNNEHSTRCRASQNELAHDRAQRLDEKEGLSPTTAEIVSVRIEELMDADSADEDSMIVLMESERFTKALRKVLSNRHDDKRCHETLVEDAVNMVSVAETVLSEYVELSL